MSVLDQYIPPQPTQDFIDLQKIYVEAWMNNNTWSPRGISNPRAYAAMVATLQEIRKRLLDNGEHQAAHVIEKILGGPA